MENIRFKVGDRVRIKSLDWYNENKNKGGDILCGELYFSSPMKKFCSNIITISTVFNNCYLVKEDNGDYYWKDEMIEGLVEEETNDCEKCGLIHNSTRCLFMDNCPYNKDKNIIEIPKDYVLKDENDNEILTSKIILEKKKKEYPKTFENCLEILGYNIAHTIPMNHGHNGLLMMNLQRLLICRDAYWKIAGEEIGLGKPWEPDWREERYIIYRNQDNIIGGYREAGCVEHHIFEFPTKEMRDAFRENFDPDIEICKELL